MEEEEVLLSIERNCATIPDFYCIDTPKDVDYRYETDENNQQFVYSHNGFGIN